MIHGTVALLLLSLAVGVSGAQTADPFLKSFSAQNRVDRPALARFLLGLSSSLSNGSQGVELLQIVAEPRSGRGGDRQGLARMQRAYQQYASTLDRMQRAAQQFLDEPGSTQRLYLMLNAGHQACSLLDRQLRMAEAYGASSAELRSVITSGSACSKFRRVAFDERIVRSVSAELVGESDLQQQNRRLREELEALEQLLEDLQKIEER